MGHLFWLSDEAWAVPPDALQHVLVSEYSPGAGIGWHRDRPEFGIIIGFSLMAPCHFRLRRKVNAHAEMGACFPDF